VPDEQLFTTLVNQYSIERELGGGGMSRVFLATEIGLGRNVVIKIVAPEIAGDVSTERFAREVKLAARLQQAILTPTSAPTSTHGA
jgi:serine/threonine-protein kinase